MISTSTLTAPDHRGVAAPLLPRTGAVAAAPAARRGETAGERAALPAVSAARALQIALAAFLLFGGASLLTDVPAFGPDYELLADLTGTGAALRSTVGVAEALGGLLLLLPAPRANAVGAVLLGALMAATAAAYVVVLPAVPVLPLALLALAAVVGYARRDALADVGDFLVRNL